MKNTIDYNWFSCLGLMIALFISSCAQESLDAELEIADGAGTLRTYKAYSIDSISGSGLEVYGRAVFWEGFDGNTYLQISLYNVAEDAAYPAGIYSGASPGGGELMSLYDIVNTGDKIGDTEEVYEFGEFSVSKFYTISEDGFFDNLENYDASIQISSDVGLVIASGDIGMNATPVETSD